MRERSLRVRPSSAHPPHCCGDQRETWLAQERQKHQPCRSVSDEWTRLQKPGLFLEKNRCTTEMAGHLWQGYNQCCPGYHGKQTRRLKSSKTHLRLASVWSISSSIYFHGYCRACSINHQLGRQDSDDLPKRRSLCPPMQRGGSFPSRSNTPKPHYSSLTHGGDR